MSSDADIKQSAQSAVKEVAEKKGPQLPSDALKRLIGTPAFPDELGRKVRMKHLSHTKVGDTRGKSGMIPIFRVNVWADWWYSESQRFPSSRIRESYYVSFDPDTGEFTDLDKSTDILEEMRVEQERKDFKLGRVNRVI